MDLYESLDALFTAAPEIVLPPAIGEALGETRWAACLSESFELGPPDSDNIGDWLEVVDSWLEAVLPALDVLERVSLEHLLDTEPNIEAWVRSGAAPETAPAPAVVPGSYPLATAAHRRTRALRLTWWDRFYTADRMGPAVARTLVAALIVGAVLYSGFVAH